VQSCTRECCGCLVDDLLFVNFRVQIFSKVRLKVRDGNGTECQGLHGDRNRKVLCILCYESVVSLELNLLRAF
jgi:hypothetical protein